MAGRPKEKKDRTSIVISLVLHGILLAAIGYWAYKSGLVQSAYEKILKVVTAEKKQPQQQPVQQKAPPPPPKLPPINTGAEQKASSGTRRAVAQDAPQAAADTFFQDTRKQVGGPTTGGSGLEQKKSETKVIIAPPPPPRSTMKAAGPTTIKQLYAERAKEAAQVEAIGSEQISKSGGSDAGDVVAKVSGATIVDGKFAVIRGLSDRYVTTTLNGAEVPSPDPYRRAASLDMFPAQVISKVSVSKTFTPDQQGSYTGGGIDIVTKSFPEKPFISFSIGGGYNTQATGNEDYLTYDGGNRDWLGIDDGTRELPEQLTGKGLVIPNQVFSSGRPGSPDYEQRIRDAEQLRELGEIMGYAQLAPEREAPPFNHNFSLAIGETTHLFGKPLGVFAGVNYKREFNFYEDGVSRRYGPNVDEKTVEVTKDLTDTRSLTEVNWAAMANLAYQLHEHHQLGFNYLRNQSSEDVARIQFGQQRTDPDTIFVQNRLHFTERTLETFQLKGGHVMPALGNVRLDWLGAMSKTSQNEPDVRFLNYAIKPGPDYILNLASTPEPRAPTRYFRNLEEDNRNLKADLTFPFWQWTMDDSQLKAGFWDSDSERTYFDREIYYEDGSNTPDFDGDANSILKAINRGYVTRTNPNQSISFLWNRFIKGRTSYYDGDYRVRAGYGMVDVPVFSWLRLVGGARVETTDILINSVSYQPSPITGEATNRTELSEVSILPAASLVWGVTSNMNVRAGYSQTLARPSFRELAAVRSYDPILDEVLEGNPLLEMIESQNYDLRWEWFFRPGELISVGGFYKQLKNAIEKKFVTQDQDIVTFDNRPEANVFGVEFEARKSLGFLGSRFDHLSIGGNLALIWSEVDLTPEELKNKRDVDPGFSDTRPMYDQSPYILNLDLSYDNPRAGTSAALVFNVAGPRVTIAAITTDDIYEQPAPSLDFIISQRIGRNLAIKFAVKNILNPEIERTVGEDGKSEEAIDLNGDGIPDRIYTSYRRGVTFSVGLSYDF